MKHKIIPRCVIEDEIEELGEKPLRRPPSSKLIHQRISWNTRITKDSPSLVYPMYLSPSKLLLPIDLMKPCLLQLSQSRNSAQLHPPNDWLLPMFHSSTKTSLYTQYGCGKCLDYQPLKNLNIERQELRKTTKHCVEDCKYNNL